MTSAHRDWPDHPSLDQEPQIRATINLLIPTSRNLGVAVEATLALEHHRSRSPSMDDALRRARLEAEARAVMSAAAPDLGPELASVEAQLHSLERAEQDLRYAQGVWEHTAVEEAHNQLFSARRERSYAEDQAANRYASFLHRHKWKKEARHLGEVEQLAEARFEELAGHERKGLAARRKDLEASKSELEAGIERREEWLDEHPEVGLRLEAIGSELTELGLRRQLSPALDQALGLDHDLRVPVLEHPRLDHGLGLEL